MKYLPFEHLVFKSRLREEQIGKNLSKFMIYKYPHKFSSFRSYDDTNYYVGSLERSGFKITVRCAKNSFTPVITAHYTNDGLETIVNVRMRLHKIMFLFSAIWAVPLLALFVVMIVESIIHREWGPIILFPLGMVSVFYLFAMRGFKIASKEAVKHLENALEAKAIQI